jgi:hypothetical protein
MRKQWVALLSMLGLAGSGMPVRSQVVKGSAGQGKAVHNPQAKAVNGNAAIQRTNGSSKLNLNQQTLRQQNQGLKGGKQADTMTPSAYCKGRANNQLTPPPPGGANKAVTKGGSNQAVTKGGSNQAVTKGGSNQFVTKGGSNQAVTKGGSNPFVTKGGSNRQVTKGSAVQTTAAAGPR